MKTSEIILGATYMTKHAGRWIPVRVVRTARDARKQPPRVVFALATLAGKALPRFRTARELRPMSSVARTCL